MIDQGQPVEDPEPELLHWVLRSPSARAMAGQELIDADFSSTVYQQLFRAVMWLQDEGGVVSPASVADVAGCTVATVAALWDMRPFGTDAQLVAEIRGASARRFLRRHAGDLVQRLDRNDTIERINETCDLLKQGLPTSADQWKAETFEEMAARVGDTSYKWLVPWVLERGERLLVVGPEGTGKSTVLRQWAYMLACGVHWVTQRTITPGKVLVVDAENPDVKLIRTSRWLHNYASRAGMDWDADRLRTRTMSSLDLVSHRAHRDGVESLIELHRPDLLIVGPLYKVGRNTLKSYEDSALALTDLLDDWRSRYGIAVMAEHHAAKGDSATGERAMDPKGSAVWLHWPDVGLKLRHYEQRLEDEETNHKCPEMRTHFHVGTYRGSRGQHIIPKRLRYGSRSGGEWPWVADDYKPNDYEADGEDDAVF